MKKKILSIAAICFSLVLLAACGSSGASGTTGNGGSSANGGGDTTSGSGGSGNSGTLLAKIKKRGYVTVGFSNESPYAYKNKDNKLTGAAVEVARAVFGEMGVKVKGHLAKWDNLIPGIKNGKFDVITAGMAVLPKRCKSIDFGHPSIVYGEGIAVKKGNPLDLHSYADIRDKGAKVAVLNTGSEMGFLKEVGVKKSQILPVDSVNNGFAAVKAGRADVTTATQLTVKSTVKKSGGKKLEYVSDFKQPDVKGVPSYGAAGFNQNSDALRKKYNEILDKLRKSGKIKKVITSLPLWDDSNVYNPEKDPTTKELCQG